MAANAGVAAAGSGASIVTDPLRVYGALLPKAKVASVPRAAVRLTDTVLLSHGAVWKWLSTSPGGEVIEKVHADVGSIHESFLQSALAVGGNTGRLMTLVRRASGAVQLLDVEQSVELFRRWDDEAPSIVALQVRRVEDGVGRPAVRPCIVRSSP